MIETILESGELDVVFQPILELSTGALLGHEVLGRMRSLSGPALGPVQLVELAVAEGRLFELERAWRRVAIERVAALDPYGGSQVFLNVDTRIINDSRFAPGATLALIERHRMLPQRFVFELSERDPNLGGDRLGALVRHYQSQGFGIALDDLGTGYASLHAVLELRPNTLKLCAELVRGVSRDRMRRHLIQSIVLFAVRSDLEVVAEGIETLEDLLAVRELGVAFGQGYLLGKPSPTLQVEPGVIELLRDVDSELLLAEGAC